MYDTIVVSNMAKSALQISAKELRKQGVSVKNIATQLHVSRSSVSVWVRDIVLSQEQIECLRQSELRGNEIGRQKSAELRRKRRDLFLEKCKNDASKVIAELTERELLIAGLALYWGEGSKRNRQLQFCNSDPEMIQFLLLWLQKCLHIRKGDIGCWVGINHTHEHRDKQVKEYWSNTIGIPLSQFRKTSLKRVENQKFYANFESHYGTLFVRVARPTRYYDSILAMIDALKDHARVA